MGYILTNGDRQEFYVRIKGPDESMWCYALCCMRSFTDHEQHRFPVATGKSTSNYPINTPTRVPVLASWTGFSTRTLMSCMSHGSLQSILAKLTGLQLRVSLFGRDQPNLVPNVRHGKHIWSVSAPTSALPEPSRSIERGSSSNVDEGAEELRGQSKGYACLLSVSVVLDTYII